MPCKAGDTVYVNGVLGCGEAEEYRVIRVDYHSTLGTEKNEFYIEALLCTNPDSSMAFYDKQFGNSIVVDVMCAMFKNLNIKQGDNNETLQTN